jgi:L-ribulokinase
MPAKYTIGLDYGTNSVRALIVNVANGAEIASSVWNYAHGTAGVILSRDPNLARQHPLDYVNGAEITIKAALAAAKKSIKNFYADQVIGIGVDTTGSTPLPVDANGQPLAFQKKFANNPAARPPRSPRLPKKCARNISPNAAAPIRANGFGARF